MTLRELLTETMYIRRNYYACPEKETSVISGKKILGFPGDRVSIEIDPTKDVMFDVANIGNDTYEFYVGSYKKTNGSPYKHKECYIGTYKFDKFNDGVGVAMALIRRFIDSSKINPEQAEFLKDWYNRHCEHKYYKGYFEKL